MMAHNTINMALTVDFSKVVIVQWVKCTPDKRVIVIPDDREMRVIYSDHSDFPLGSRFDYGKAEICNKAGYSLVIHPLKEE
jgi:hypothetical protein